MRKLWKIACAALLTLTMAGCDSGQNEEVNILAPSGAPSAWHTGRVR